MAADMKTLQPNFRETVEAVLAAVERKGHLLVPYFTVRTVWDQARLWRQSRSTSQVHAAVAQLRDEGASYLADVLESVGPQNGRWATNALPGYSWHQWGLAVDCFVKDPKTGDACWGEENDYRKAVALRGYASYGVTAQDHGLTWGGVWRRPDAVHVQGPSAASPSKDKTTKEINDAMLALFGPKEDKR